MDCVNPQNYQVTLTSIQVNDYNIVTVVSGIVAQISSFLVAAGEHTWYSTGNTKLNIGLPVQRNDERTYHRY